MICPTCSYDNLPGSETCVNCLHDLTQLDRPTAQDRVERSLMDDPVSVLRPHPALTLLPEATVGQAMQLMLTCNIGAVPVVDRAGRLLGIFSERDLLTKVAGAERACADEPVSGFMTPDPETVRETDTLAFALHKMDGGGYRHLPVVREGQVVGMISVRDMLRHITRLCQGGCG
jgi:signal-transduction protein with cAMP-binding, CBS, and nucleotidyltransferase domain